MNRHNPQAALQRALNVRLQAEHRAVAKIEAAEAKVQALIRDRQQRAADNAQAFIRRYLPQTEVFQEAVAVRAYFKAQQRDFSAGDVGGDWLKAEEEILSAHPFGEQN